MSVLLWYIFTHNKQTIFFFLICLFYQIKILKFIYLSIKLSIICHQSCWVFYTFWILTVNRFSGLTSIMPRSKFWQSGGTKCGIWKTPFFTFSNNWRKLSSSKGSAPTSNAYNITPHDQTSAFRPSYFSPWKAYRLKPRVSSK